MQKEPETEIGRAKNRDHGVLQCDHLRSSLIVARWLNWVTLFVVGLCLITMTHWQHVAKTVEATLDARNQKIADRQKAMCMYIEISADGKNWTIYHGERNFTWARIQNDCPDLPGVPHWEGK